MNESRNTNTPLFITVLCACLGLLTVGVPMQVVAQQSTTTAGKPQVAKEVKCSDNAPSEVKFLLREGAFIRPLAEFVAAVSKLISVDKYNLKERFSAEITIKIESNLNFRININGSSPYNDWVDVAAQSAAENIIEHLESDWVYHRDDKSEQPDKPSKRYLVTFLLEDSALVVNAKAEQSSPEQANKLAAVYNSYVSLGSCRERDQPEAILYQNTRALVENNQVLIVTHLPRAALSDLLVKSLAAN